MTSRSDGDDSVDDLRANAGAGRNGRASHNPRPLPRSNPPGLWARDGGLDAGRGQRSRRRGAGGQGGDLASGRERIVSLGLRATDAAGAGRADGTERAAGAGGGRGGSGRGRGRWGRSPRSTRVRAVHMARDGRTGNSRNSNVGFSNQQNNYPRPRPPTPVLPRDDGHYLLHSPPSESSLSSLSLLSPSVGPDPVIRGDLRLRGARRRVRDPAPPVASPLQGPAPGLERIMRRLFRQTALGLGTREDSEGALNFIGLLDDMLDAPPIDIRRPDRLVCPTCMTVHLPVMGSERIAMPLEPNESIEEEFGGECVLATAAVEVDNNDGTGDAEIRQRPASLTRETNSVDLDDEADPRLPRAELRLHDFGSGRGDAEEEVDDDADDEADDDDDDEESASFESLPPLSSHNQSSFSSPPDSLGSLDSFPPLAPHPGVHNQVNGGYSNGTSFNASSATTPYTLPSRPVESCTVGRSMGDGRIAGGESGGHLEEAIAQFSHEATNELNPRDGHDGVYSDMPNLENIQSEGAGAAQRQSGNLIDLSATSDSNGSSMPSLRDAVDVIVGDGMEDIFASNAIPSHGPSAPSALNSTVEMNERQPNAIVHDHGRQDDDVAEEVDSSVLSSSSLSMPPLDDVVDEMIGNEDDDGEGVATVAINSRRHSSLACDEAEESRDPDGRYSEDSYEEEEADDSSGGPSLFRLEVANSWYEMGEQRYGDGGRPPTPFLPPIEDLEEMYEETQNSLGLNQGVTPPSSASSASLPPLITRADLSSSSSSLSMPALIRREVTSSEEEQVDGTNAEGRERPLPGGPGVSRFQRFLLGQVRRAEALRAGEVSSTEEDRTPTNPLTHLRDYGALRVFAEATCPVCLDECNPIVALRCGHALCEEDHRRMGGYLSSDKDKLKAAASGAIAAPTLSPRRASTGVPPWGQPPGSTAQPTAVVGATLPPQRGQGRGARHGA